MTKLSTYRSLHFALAAVFVVFSVGVPVVLATCPMKTEQSEVMMCAGCFQGTPDGDLTISRYMDTSCCTTIFAADRNTTEFVLAKEELRGLTGSDSGILLTPMTVVAFEEFAPKFIASSHSPPHSRDIPILCSTLLI